MKANETPEKLYFNECSDEIIFEIYSIKEYDDDIEYTRTDVFMKKAENFLEMLGYGFTITDEITHNTYDVEQLIADFRNYMEGVRYDRQKNKILP